MLGSHDEGVTYRKAELKTFVSLGVEDKLEEDEIAILGSVLEFSGKTVQDIMVSLSRANALMAGPERGHVCPFCRNNCCKSRHTA